LFDRVVHQAARLAALPDSMDRPPFKLRLAYFVIDLAVLPASPRSSTSLEHWS
jgi:hypothetical protein